MPDDFVPSNDADFDLFQKQFVAKVTTEAATYGVTQQDITNLQTAQAPWTAAYPAHMSAQAAAQTATQTKITTRDELTTVIRGTARKIQGTAGIDNSHRVAAGLPPRDDTRSPLSAPTTRPIGRLESRGHLTLVVHFADEETPKRTAKPPGVDCCEIYSFVGDTPPADRSEFKFLAFDTRTPYVDEHAVADAGKMVHYILRWQNSKRDTGPWSDIVSARIPV